MEQRKCKKCGMILPEWHKKDCCEKCINKNAKKMKKIGKVAINGVVTIIALVAGVVSVLGFLGKNKDD